MSEEVSLLKEGEIHYADHEILLSFNNDSGAIAFEEWWYEQGKKLFDKYVDEDFKEFPNE